MKRTFIAAVLALSVGAAFANPDAVVIGAGGAGLSAAVTLHDLGREVVVLEKMPMIGGNTVRAEGGINAAETPQQKKAGIPDTIDQFYADTMKGGHNLNDPALVRTLTTHAKDAVAWLVSLGADLNTVGRAGGAKYPRAHRPTDGSAIGREVIRVLWKAAKDRKMDVRTQTRATEIIMKDGRVAGVKATNKDGKVYTIDAKAVVLATGGFGANQDMLVKYQPKLKGYATTNQPGATGDGIILAEHAGAALVDMKQIQAHPTAAPDGTLISESVRGDGGILINAEGKRFTNELLTRDVVSAAELKQPGRFAWVFWDDATRKSAKLMDSYISMGLAVKGNTVAEIAKAMNVPAAELEATLKAYAAGKAAGKDAFGRADMPQAMQTAPFFAVKVQPAVHHTMGGVKIDTKAEVLNPAGHTIPGLFAAGEVTGGVHGGNRLGGNAQADIVTFGRIAGQSADAYLKSAQ
ncbi:flavocytochrome c [Sutterella wadsworthensis]|uniref:flavocytochrome c n=1 Tax=Sutterella wadsworthensis TaxID=40545 RepID=UPI003AF0595F